MDNNEKLFRNLLIILKMFKNRPYHLAKYLVDNSAFDEAFIAKILKSEKLNDINEKEAKDFFPESEKPIYFSSISEMNDYYNSLMDEVNLADKTKLKKTIEEMTSSLNEKLNLMIREERYEDAARLRDYMIKNNIERIIKNI